MVRRSVGAVIVRFKNRQTLSDAIEIINWTCLPDADRLQFQRLRTLKFTPAGAAHAHRIWKSTP
jgi:hypothetical protein